VVSCWWWVSTKSSLPCASARATLPTHLPVWLSCFCPSGSCLQTMASLQTNVCPCPVASGDAGRMPLRLDSRCRGTPDCFSTTETPCHDVMWSELTSASATGQFRRGSGSAAARADSQFRISDGAASSPTVVRDHSFSWPSTAPRCLWLQALWLNRLGPRVSLHGPRLPCKPTKKCGN
jgi:hypothetical protein